MRKGSEMRTGGEGATVGEQGGDAFNREPVSVAALVRARLTKTASDVIFRAFVLRARKNLVGLAIFD